MYEDFEDYFEDEANDNLLLDEELFEEDRVDIIESDGIIFDYYSGKVTEIIGRRIG